MRRIVRRFASTAAHLSGRKHRGRGACLESLFGKWLDSNLDSKLRLGRFWSPLGSVLGALGCVLGALGAVLVALGDSWGALGGLLGALGHVLGVSGPLLEASWPVQVTNATPSEPKRLQNRLPEASGAQNTNSSKSIPGTCNINQAKM